MQIVIIDIYCIAYLTLTSFLPEHTDRQCCRHRPTRHHEMSTSENAKIRNKDNSNHINKDSVEVFKLLVEYTTNLKEI